MASVLNQAIRNSGGIAGEDGVDGEHEDKLKGTGTETQASGSKSIGTKSHTTEKSAIDETELLEGLFKKMALLTSLFVEQNVVDEAKMQSLDNESRGVIVEVMRYGRGEKRRSSRKGSLLSRGSQLSEVPLPDSELQSWGLNILNLEAIDRPKI